jgi:hypothetical protein
VVHSTPGCEDTEIESCVCAYDSYCCTTSWDSLCVSEVVSYGCGTCESDTDTETDTDAYLLFVEDWEDGIWNDSWTAGSGSYTREVTSAIAADSTTYSVHLVGSAETSHCDGIYTTVGALQPSVVSYWARSGSDTAADAYFVIEQGSTADPVNCIAFIYFNASGQILIAGPNIEVQSYTANTWYKIELRDIDWAGKHYDVYVDGELRSSDVPFRDTSKTSIGRIDLYNYHDSEAWWDEIVFYE